MYTPRGEFHHALWTARTLDPITNWLIYTPHMNQTGPLKQATMASWTGYDVFMHCCDAALWGICGFVFDSAEHTDVKYWRNETTKKERSPQKLLRNLADHHVMNMQSLSHFRHTTIQINAVCVYACMSMCVCVCVCVCVRCVHVCLCVFMYVYFGSCGLP
jgi:hypothetical protein